MKTEKRPTCPSEWHASGFTAAGQMTAARLLRCPILAGWPAVSTEGQSQGPTRPRHGLTLVDGQGRARGRPQKNEGDNDNG